MAGFRLLHRIHSEEPDGIGMRPHCPFSVLGDVHGAGPAGAKVSERGRAGAQSGRRKSARTMQFDAPPRQPEETKPWAAIALKSTPQRIDAARRCA
jgi:hypothetical protein